ncbi:MAG: vancomycin resistance protein YoaR [Polyangiales bacterium]|jgi:vancomycin resistance protein YoaR
MRAFRVFGVLSGLLSFGLLLSFAPTAAADENSRLFVGGVEVSEGMNAATLADAIEALPVDIRYFDVTATKTWAELGASVDRVRLARLLQGETRRAEVRVGAPLDIEAERAASWLLALKRDRDRPAHSARVDSISSEVVAEQEGFAVDVWATLEAQRHALASGESFDVVVHRTGAHRGVSDFEGLSFDTLLGEFETPYNGSGDAAERTHNLRVAAAKIDGVVLFPGEQFDYNEVVGERSLAEGFRPATVIAGGELVDGVGGGACQNAGTLHAAAFFAGLEIVERHPHSRPSSYIKLGLDAAVSYPNLNFRMRNNRETPVLVRMRIDGGRAIAQIFGDERHDRVQFVRRIDEFLPFEERTIEDDSYPTGVRVLTQRGVPGFVVSRYRIIEDVRTRVMRRETSQDRYPPTTQTWHVGTGGPAPDGFETPDGDTHREYTADEFTIMTQGAGVEGTTTTRRAGRTGSHGWTVEQGMPPASAD